MRNVPNVERPAGTRPPSARCCTRSTPPPCAKPAPWIETPSQGLFDGRDAAEQAGVIAAVFLEFFRRTRRESRRASRSEARR